MKDRIQFNGRHMTQQSTPISQKFRKPQKDGVNFTTPPHPLQNCVESKSGHGTKVAEQSRQQQNHRSLPAQNRSAAVELIDEQSTPRPPSLVAEEGILFGVSSPQQPRHRW